MIKFNKIYEDNNTYPITLKQYLINLCTQVGLELGSENIVNEDYLVKGNPFTNNEDCKTVLGAIAQICGGFAKIGRNNKVYIVNLEKNSSLENIDGNNYNDSFSKNSVFGKVNSLIIRLSDIEGENTVREDAESIIENGLTEITIADNYILTNKEERELVIDAIWEKVKDIEYLPFNTEYYGFPYLDVGDKINILDNQDVSYQSYILNHTFHFNGAFSGNIETKALNKTQTAYKNTVNLKNKFKKVEYIVNKQEGTITQLTEESNEHGYKLTQVEQDINGIKTEIKDTTDEIQDKLTTIEETIDGLITNKTVTGGQNLIKNSVGYFENDYWQINEDTEGNVIRNTSSDVKQNSISGSALELKKETIYQNITEIKNGEYYLSFMYKKTNSAAIANLKINDLEIELNELNWSEIERIIEVNSNAIKIEITTDIDNSVLITDLMLAEGNIKTSWTQNANESYTDTVQIGKGVRIRSTGSDTELSAESDGVSIKNTETSEKVAEFTKYGTETQELIVHKNVKISEMLLIQKIGDQVWFCSM
ncbi:MAG: hypothetical protein E7310_06540 [Clostridiales bacterium]|nr:hypothetical protein [Clostridiales bacterium]